MNYEFMLKKAWTRINYQSQEAQNISTKNQDGNMRQDFDIKTKRKFAANRGYIFLL